MEKYREEDVGIFDISWRNSFTIGDTVLWTNRWTTKKGFVSGKYVTFSLEGENIHVEIEHSEKSLREYVDGLLKSEFVFSSGYSIKDVYSIKLLLTEKC
jgi:hypothetical protein